jgi:ubiquinone/menaquinone biosynthesis C-methylase UbiE
MNEAEDQARIELLSVGLLREFADRARYFRGLSRRLLVTPGWHYLLDWIWIDQQLKRRHGTTVLDAGAGLGMMQWHLAKCGAHVLSVDRSDRIWVPLHFRYWYRARRAESSESPATPGLPLGAGHGKSLRDWALAVGRGLVGSALHLGAARAEGEVELLTNDLRSLSGIASESVDLVVAISSLEHNTPEDAKVVLEELWRVIKPGGIILATMSAAKDRDWFHAPSAGWCYTDATLRELFRVPATTHSNFAEFDTLMGALRDCAELRKGLPRAYYRSGDNGMPWGVWDPKYLPVGIRTSKPG